MGIFVDLRKSLKHTRFDCLRATHIRIRLSMAKASSARVSNAWLGGNVGGFFAMEADDRAAEKFTAKFYTAYFTGTSVAGAMQSAAIAMIREKSAGLHERTIGQLLLFMVIIDDPTKASSRLKDP
jgi:hypothetical protein